MDTETPTAETIQRISPVSSNGIKQLLKEGGPGAYTPEGIEKAKEIIIDLIKELGVRSRELAKYAGKNRVTEEEIKIAAKYLIKNN